MKSLFPVGMCLSLFVSAVLHADDGDEAELDAAFATASAQQALDRYLEEIEEIERVANKRKKLARRRLAAALQQTKRAEVDLGPRYRGMLGSYHDSAGRIPYVLLSVPDGSNVLSRRFWDAINKGHGVQEPLYRFEARGHVKIPAAGSYRLETGRGYGQVKLNETSYALRQATPGKPLHADVELDQGVYEVYYSVGNNGGQMNDSMLRISNAENGEVIPIFIYNSDLKAFLHDLSLGVELTETSGWLKKENRID